MLGTKPLPNWASCEKEALYFLFVQHENRLHIAERFLGLHEIRRRMSQAAEAVALARPPMALPGRRILKGPSRFAQKSPRQRGSKAESCP
jgi:hypothetical protein